MHTFPSIVRQRAGVLAIALVLAAAASLSFVSSAQAAVHPKVPLATTAYYSVLAGSTVTNTGNSVLAESVGLSPGTSVTGFPPGIVNAPGVIRIADAAALQAKNDLTAAYNDAQNRTADAIVAADLGTQVLLPGIYSTTGKGALLLTGVLTLDGNGDAASVFIIQTNSTLDTAVGSVVSLINGATACNVFWAVGSSATLGTGSTFAGNIFAEASISLSDSVTVNGRAMARTGAVTLINDTFVTPTCDVAVAATTTTTAASGSASGSPTGSSTGTDIGLVTGAPTTGATPLNSTSLTWVIMSLCVLCIGVGLIGYRIVHLKSKV